MAILETPWRANVRLVAAALIASALLAFAWTVRRLAAEPLSAAAPAPTAPERAPALAFTSNEECRPCHTEVWDEWVRDQHSQAWFNDPLFPRDPKRTECSPCHAPEPILEAGLDQPARVRAARHAEGVGCIECHKNGAHVEGPSASGEAPCRPRANASFVASEVCAPCHAAHGTLDEWRASAWAERGFTCQACHMPWVERASASGGSVRRVRSHHMRSQRDPAVLREALALELELAGRELRVRVANVGAGHAVPGEIFNRELVLRTRFLAADGVELDARRESFKAVPREQRASEPSTQLAAGETRAFAYPAPAAAARADVQLVYKDFYLMPDEAGREVHARSLEF